MAKQVINLGTVPGDDTGDNLRTGGDKINDNFDEIYEGGNIDKRQYTTGLTNPTHSEGLVFYDDTKKALSYYNDENDTTVNIGQELIVKVYNNNGATITNGTAVRLTTPVGGLPTVERSLADTIENARCIGVATHDIPVDGTGYITVLGSLSSYDTSSFTPGDTLFVSATVAGELTNVEQVILNPVAVALDSEVDGTILVASRGVQDITAIAQALGTSGNSQSVSTTPQPLSVFDVSTFSKNVSVGQDLSGGSYTTRMAPASPGASGFYRVDFSISITSTQNKVYSFEVYIDGVATGVIGVADLSNGNIDDGSTAFSIITPSVVTNAEEIEIYVSCDSGTPTITLGSCSFSVERIGNV